jgi:hypothetical protein
VWLSNWKTVSFFGGRSLNGVVVLPAWRLSSKSIFILFVQYLDVYFGIWYMPFIWPPVSYTRAGTSDVKLYIDLPKIWVKLSVLLAEISDKDNSRVMF